MSPRLAPALYSGHFQKIAALSSSLCPELVLTATATYNMTWQHCSVSTHVVTDVCQAGRNLRAPCCCFLMLADVQGSFLVSVPSSVPPGPLGEESSPCGVLEGSILISQLFPSPQDVWWMLWAEWGQEGQTAAPWTFLLQIPSLDDEISVPQALDHNN